MSGANIKAIIDAAVTTNANEENTGARVNDALNDMVDVLLDYNFGGVILPAGVNSDDTDLKWWYIASTDGTYTNYGGFTIDHEFAIITYDGSFTKHSFGNNYLPTFPDDASLVLLGDGTFGTPTTPSSNYKEQSFTSATEVVVNHIFGAYPVVDVILSTGQIIKPYTIVHNTTTKDTVTVTFTSAQTGTVICTLGGENNSYVTKSVDYTLTEEDRTVEVITNTGTTQTLPTLTVVQAGKKYRIISTVNSTIVDTEGGETIGNAATGNPTSVLLQAQEWLDVEWNGTNYRII